MLRLSCCYGMQECNNRLHSSSCLWVILGSYIIREFLKGTTMEPVGSHKPERLKSAEKTGSGPLADIPGFKSEV